MLLTSCSKGEERLTTTRLVSNRWGHLDLASAVTYDELALQTLKSPVLHDIAVRFLSRAANRATSPASDLPLSSTLIVSH
jgi:hypothetical protein